MAGSASTLTHVARPHSRRGLEDPRWLKYTLLGIAFGFVLLFLVVPLTAVFVEALRKGLGLYFTALTEADAVAAIRLTLLAASISVPLNLVFGVAAAWAIAKVGFHGAGRGRRGGGDPAHVARRQHLRAAQPRVRRGGGLGDREVRVSRQIRPHHAD